jgi:hypothetical protein
MEPPGGPLRGLEALFFFGGRDVVMDEDQELEDMYGTDDADASTESTGAPKTLDDVHSALQDVVTGLKRLPQRRQARGGQLEYGSGPQYVSSQGDDVTLVNTPNAAVENDYVVSIQALSLPPGFGGTAPSTTCGVLRYRIQYAQGESDLEIEGYLSDLEAQTIDISARQIQVSVAWLNAPAGTAPCRAIAGVGRTMLSHPPTRPNVPTWFRTPAAGYATGTNTAANSKVVGSANTQLAVPASGGFRGASGAVTAITAATTVYIMLFDAPTTGTAPTTGAVPIWTSDALQAGQSFSALDDSGRVAWIYGLWVGASTTPIVMTAPNEVQFACDVLGG